MTFSVLKRHANVIFGLFSGLLGRLNRLSASFTGSSQSQRYGVTNRSHGGNSPFPRRERFVPMWGTSDNHHRNDWFPWREQRVTTRETKGYHEGGASSEVSGGHVRRKRSMRAKEADEGFGAFGRHGWYLWRALDDDEGCQRVRKTFHALSILYYFAVLGKI